jgi:hypothetical protein
MIREIINRFRSSLTERLVAYRRRHTAPMRVWFEPEVVTPQSLELARSRALSGETVDMSRTGIAFLVNSIRVKEKYLVGQNRRLNVEIDLPSGKVSMQVEGRRYQKVGVHLSAEKFLVGAHILRIDPENNAIYDHFLRHGAEPSNKPSAAFELNAK